MHIGDQMPDFELKGTDGKLHALNDFAGKKVLALIVTCNHCPYAQAYIQRIAAWSDQYRDSDVQLIAVNGNDAGRYPQDSFGNMPEMDALLKLDGLYLHDESQSFLEAIRAQRTPEVFVFDADRKLRYHGAPDDNYEDASAVSANYMTDAIEALLKDEAPAQAESNAVGCSIKWKPVSS